MVFFCFQQAVGERYQVENETISSDKHIRAAKAKAINIAKRRGYRGFQNDIIATQYFGSRSETLQANIYDVLEYAHDTSIKNQI
ncbi:MAG: hypothetical protein ACPG5B_02190 [Chitinophagales bacterium]